MSTASIRTRRLLEAAPVLAAFAVHALAFERFVLPALAAAISAAVVLRPYSASPSRQWMFLSGGVGLLAGLAGLAVAPPPPGPLPPLLASALTGMCIGFAAYGVAAQRPVPAMGAAWVLTALSSGVDGSVGLSVCLVVFMFTTLIGVISSARLWSSFPGIILPLGLFAVATVFATVAIAAGIQRLDGRLQRALESLYAESQLPATSGVRNDLTVDPRSSIKLSDRPLLDISQSCGPLRMRVLDCFDGRRWMTSSRLLETVHQLDESRPPSSADRVLDITFLDTWGDRIPAPAGIRQVHGATAIVEGGWVMRSNDLGRNVSLVGDPDENLPQQAVPEDSLLAVPDALRIELEDAAREIVREGQTTSQKVALLERFFQHNFQYALDTNLTGPEHPLVILVRQRRPAYCVYFASAMATMLRTQQIPARVVTGFVPNEINPITGRVTIRSRDAHAWVEYWNPEQGRFVAVDPTPTRSRRAALGIPERPGFLSACGSAFGSVLRRGWIACREHPTGLLISALKSPVVWAFCVALAVFAVRRLRLGHWSQRRAECEESGDALLKQAYRRYAKSLRQAGIRPQPWETDEELLARLAEACGTELMEKAEHFLRQYRRARFRGETAGKELLESAALGVKQKA